VDLHVYHHFASDPKLDEILNKLSALAAQVDTMNAQIQQIKDDVVAIKAKAAAISDVATATVTTLNGFSAIVQGLVDRIAELIANGGLSAEDKAALTDIHGEGTQIVTELGAGAQKIADAIVANPPNPPNV